MIELRSKEKKSPEVFSVHKALLCFYSPYHDRLLNGAFAEGLTAPTEPLTINAGRSVLKLFFAWLYSGEIYMATPLPSEKNYTWHQGITKLYILADELNCIALQRKIISVQVAITESLGSLPGYDIIGLLSNCSLESSGLYQYLWKPTTHIGTVTIPPTTVTNWNQKTLCRKTSLFECCVWPSKDHRRSLSHMHVAMILAGTTVTKARRSAKPVC